MSNAFGQLRRQLREMATLGSIGSLLRWDQETMMPLQGTDVRAEALALIGRLHHERFTGPQVGELLAECEADAALCADPLIAANLRELRRDYDRARRIPADWVAASKATGAHAQVAWRAARADNDFARFRPWLDRQLELNRQRAELLGTPPGGEPYDALLEDFEPGVTTAWLEATFAPLREALTVLIGEVGGSPRRPDHAPLRARIPVARQRQFHQLVLARIGFDLDAGRLDESAHPFSTGIAPGDTRMTSRFNDQRFADGLSSTLHEAGHSLYEQGLSREWWGLPLGEPLGLGIHESQSRLWENQVGRSRAFWTWALPEARRAFAPALDPFDLDAMYAAINIVEPHLIRVESDEATYNLHIMMRFDLERALLSGDLPVDDLPGAWNERMRTDLGIDVPDDARGCLQDIHWAMGSIGYFPTYTLGNLYAAQFFEAFARQSPDWQARLAGGDFSVLRAWLRERIHVHGRRLSADALCRDITGAPLDHAALIRYLRGKLSEIYHLD